MPEKPKKFDPYYKWLAISPEDQPPDLYRLLAVQTFEDDPDVIEAAADQRMVHLRTFQSGKHSAESQKLLNEVAAAKVCLLNPDKKAAYDVQLEEQGSKQFAIDTSKAEKTAVAEPDTADKKRKLVLGVVIGGGALAAAVALAVIIGLSGDGGKAPDDDAVASGDPDPKQPATPLSPEDEKDHPDPPVVVDPEPPVVELDLPVVEPEPPVVEPEPPVVEPDPPVVEPEPEPEPQKIPIPSDADQQEIVKQLNDIYELSKSRTSAEKVKLAEELYKQSEQSEGKHVERFVLLRKAMELAGEGGDADLMLRVIDDIADRFEVDPWIVRAKTLRKFYDGANTSKRIESFITSTDPLIDRALEEGKYEIAEGLADRAYHLGHKSLGKEFRKQTHARREEVREHCKGWKELKVARKTLEKDPQNPEANLAVGRWHCFSRGDWKQGLPYLSKGSDAELKSLAEQELNSPPKETAELVRLADAWWTLAEGKKGIEKKVLLLRAGFWYETAGSGALSGLVRLRIDRRLAEIAKIAKIDQSLLGDPRRPKSKKLPKQFTVDLPGDVKMEFVLIPAGQFVMGSPDAPQHKVKISRPFYLGKYEVTQAQWEAVMGNNPSQFKDPSNPVEKVSWDDIQPFLAKLNVAFEKKRMLFGLPTEAGWEYACRAGTTTAFSFGDNPALLAQHGWFNGNSGGKTHPVGQGKPNAWGLYDMHGNVWEWCSDWHGADYYAKSPPNDPMGPTTGSCRVGRGGSWRHPPTNCGAAFRIKAPPGSRDSNLGFRLASVRVIASSKQGISAE